ncbi:MAG: T9SS type A sorting domain-containing protein [Bacteroidota bacterium]
MNCLSSNIHLFPHRFGRWIRPLGLWLALLCSLSLQAQTWVGGGDGTSWNDPANWDNNAVPGPGDDVTINTPGFAILVPGAGSGTITPIRSLDINTSISNLRIINGGLLTIDGTGGPNAFGLRIQGGGFIFQVDIGGLLQIQHIDGRGIVNTNRSNFNNEGTVSIENTTSDGLLNEVTQDNMVLNFTGSGDLLLDNVATVSGNGVHNQIGGNTTFNGIINFDQGLVDIDIVGNNDGWRNAIETTVNQSTINIGLQTGLGGLIMNNIARDGIANFISATSINQCTINFGPTVGAVDIDTTGRHGIHNELGNDGLVNMEISGEMLLQNAGGEAIHNNAANTSEINFTNSNSLTITTIAGAGILNQGTGQVVYVNNDDQDIRMLNVGTTGIVNLDGSVFVNRTCAFIGVGSTPTGLLQTGGALFSNFGLLNIAGTVGNDATSAGTFNNTEGRVLVTGGTPSGFTGATPNPNAALNDSDGVLDGIGGLLSETGPLYLVANGQPFADPLVFCEGDPDIVLSVVNDPGGGIYAWSNGDSLVSTLTLAALPDSSGLYSVTITDETAGPGCETYSAFISLVVNPAPPAIAAGGTTSLEICSDEPAGAGRRVTLSDGSPLIDSIAWSLISSPTAGVLTDFFSIIGPNGRTAEALTTAPAGDYILEAQTFSADGCASLSVETFTITINAVPTGTIALSQPTICADAMTIDLTFTASAGTGPFTVLLGSDADGNDSFDPADNLTVTQNNMGNPLMSGDVISIQRLALEDGGIAGDYEIRLRTITDSEACQQVGVGQDVALTINPTIIDATVSPMLAEVCAANDNLQLAVDAVDVGAGLVTPPSGFTYSWSLSAPGLGSLDDASLINPTFTPAAGLTSDAQLTATVTIADAEGQCTATFSRQINLFIPLTPTATAINTCTSEGMSYNLTLNNATVNPNSGGVVQWFEEDPDNGGTRIDNLATTGTNEETTFNLTTFINGGGTLWAAIVNGPCREAIPITVNFNDPQGTISVASRSCDQDGQITLTFNTPLAGNFMIDLATDENDGNGFAATSNPYTVADGDLIVLTAGVDYDAAAVQLGVTHTLSIQLQRIEDAAGCFLDGLTTTVATIVDPDPQVLLRSNGATVNSGDSISVCNGSPAGYSLRLTGNNPDDLDVEFLVTNITMVPPMSVDLSAAWQLNTAYAAVAGPYPTETPVPTPVLAAGALSGAITYEVVPQTTNENCQAGPITFTIQLEETPNVFVVEGITADTLCNGTSPSVTLATNFFPNNDVEFTITVIDDDTGDGDDGVVGGMNQVIDGSVAVYDPINNYSTFSIPDVLSNADADGTPGDEYEAQTIHYQIAVNRKNPPGPNCGFPEQIDLFFTIFPDAFDLLSFANNDTSICSGENSDISIGLTVEGNEFVGPVEGGPHKIQLLITPMAAPDANNPSMISLPAATTIIFGNDPDGPDDITGTSDDEVLSFDIADLLANATGNHARIAYQFEATLITPTGDELCTHVFPEEVVVVNPEPVLAPSTLTSICSGTGIPVVDLVTENPMSAAGAMPALQNVTADWTITSLPTGVTATAMMGTEQVTPAMAGTILTLTNMTTTAQVVSLEFVPQNAVGCMGTPLVVDLTVNPLPDGDISFATGNESICIGENIQLDFSTTTGTLPYDILIGVDPTNPDDADFVYENLAPITVTNPADGISIANGDLPLALQSFIGEMSIRLISITDANGCVQFIGDDVDLTINELPNITANGPRRFCQNDDRAVFINVAGGSGDYSYTWSPAVAFADPTIEDAVFLASVTPGTYPVTVNVTDNQSGCMASASLDIIIESLPDVALMSSPSTICEGGSIILDFSETIDAGLPFTITAIADDGVGGTATMMQAGNTDTGSLTFTEGTDFNGSVTLTDIEVIFDNPPSNCSRSYPDIAVTVIPDPTVMISYTNPTAAQGMICSGDTVQVALSTNASGVEGTDYVYRLADIVYDFGNDGVDGTGAYPTGVTGNFVIGQNLPTGALLSDVLTNTNGEDVLIRYRVQAVLLNAPNCEGPLTNIAVIVKPAAPTPTVTLALDVAPAPISGSSSCPGTQVAWSIANPSAAQLIFHLDISNPDEVFGAGVLPSGLQTEADGLIIAPTAAPYTLGTFTATDAGTLLITLTPYADANSNGMLDPEEQACPGATIDLGLNVVASPDISLTYNSNPSGNAGEICSGSALDVGLSSSSTGTEGVDYEFVIMNIRHDDGMSGDNDILTPSGSASGYGPVNGSLAVGDVVSGGLTETLINTLSTDVRVAYQVKTRLINAPNCEGPARWVNVVVKGALTASITPVSPVCLQDAPFNLTAMPAGGLFSGPGITDMSLGTFDPMDAGVGTHTINYSFTDGSGCTATASTTITVGPDITFPPAGPFCVDAAPTILPAMPAGGIFSGPGVDPSTGEFDPAAAGVGVQPITYTFTDGSGCTGQVTIMITVGPSLAPTIDPAGPFCVNEPAVNLTAMPTGGTFSGPGITDGAVGTFDPATAGLGVQTITYEVMINGCMATTTIMITVQDLPVITFGPPPSVCVDRDPVVISVLPAGGMLSGPGIDAVASTFDPGAAGLGTHVIRYTVTDANGCSNTDSITITVPECIDPFITNMAPSISDPCVCLTNGRFSEEVAIFSNPGETWTINSTTLLNPLSGLPFLAGTALVEVPINVDTSSYVITGIHLDGAGYTLSASSPDQPGLVLTISNTCFYPQLEFVGLNNAYCSDANSVVLQASAGGAAGMGLIRVNGNSLPTTEDPVTGIWSADLNAVPLPDGSYTVNFSFDAGTAGSMDPNDPGCVVDISDGFQLISSAGALACNDTINLSLDNLCQGEVSADFILEGTYMLDIFQVFIYDANNDTLTGPIDASYVGQYLTASVVDTCSGNSCWGVIFVEDKFAPSLSCGRDTIDCDEDRSPQALGLPIPSTAVATATGANSFSVSGLDSCGLVTLTYVDNETTSSCQGEFASKIFRTWTVVDNSGNSDSCIDTICILRATLASIDLPENFDGISNPAFVCSDTWPQTAEGFPSPDTTGRPGNTGCFNIQSTFSDTRIDVCEGTYKILRRWTILDWCSSGGVRFHNQVIKVMDNVAPSLTCPADFTIAMNPDLCVASDFIPVPTANDLCSSTFSITASSPGITINQSGNLISISNVAAGVYTITYTVTDDCGNSASCSAQMTVEDQMPPSAICDLNTTATLQSDGTVQVMAMTFDDGSFDNCGAIFAKVRRMDINGCDGLNGDDNPATPAYDEWFDDSAWFCCADIDTVMVIFRVYDVDPGAGPVDESRHQQGGDLFGRFNDCMVRVFVQDNAPAALICPPDITISCTFNYDINDLAADFGQIVDDPALRQTISINDPGNTSVAQPNDWGLDGVVSSSCGDLVSETVSSNLNSCGIGTITRTFSPAGSSSSCTQTITIQDFNPFTVSDITWPADIEVMGCSGGGADVSVTGRPSYMNTACKLLADTFTQEVFNFNDACSKIFRYWVVIDWCSFDNATGAGVFRDTQVITILDTVDPVFTSACSDTMVCVPNTSCEIDLSLTATASDDCTPDSLLRWEWAVDLDNDGSFETTGTGPTVSGIYQLGTHLIRWIVRDGCNNSSTCERLVTVADCTAPNLICRVAVGVPLPPRTGSVDVNASLFNLSTTDNCSPPDSIRFTFSSDINDTLLTLDCLTARDTIELDIFAFDQFGNRSDSCTVSVRVTGCDSPPTATITGDILTEEGLEMEDVMVRLDGGMNTEEMTDLAGGYAFDSLPTGYNYTITPEKNTDPLNGVTTFDLVLMSKHILGVEPLGSPYKIIAADVNASGTVTTFDMLQLRKLILRIDNEFRDNTSWRFVDRDYRFPDPVNPFASAFPEAYFVNGLAQDLRSNFVAIKTGDVNCSAVTNLLGADDRGDYPDLIFQLEEQGLQAGQSYEVRFTAEDFEELLGYQFSLNFDPDLLEFVGVQGLALPELSADNFGLHSLERGLITTSWHRPQGLTISEGQPLFALRFRAKGNGRLSEALALGEASLLQAEAYRKDGQSAGLMDVALDFVEQAPSARFVLHQNRPNPFRNETLISFELPEAGAATLSIYDLSGKLLQVYEGAYEAGYNELSINRGDLPHGGLLYYQLDTPGHTAIRKMTLLD